MLPIDANDAHLLPVGAILPFAGPIPANLAALGWLHCNGQLLSTAKPYDTLFAAIGSSFGADKTQGKFNVPDLRGVFLRGVTGTSTRDPNATTRTALNPGGNIGNGVGSIQPYATAKPRTPFKVSVSNANVGNNSSNDGCEYKFGNYRGGTTDIKSTVGGDRESRPVNGNVNYIIKCDMWTSEGDLVQPPPGSVCSYGGITDNGVTQHWIACNGDFVTPKGEFAALVAAMNGVHGRIGTEQYRLPSYQGYFLRGVSETSNRDPDAASRSVPFPAGKAGEQGNAGNAVGSIQSWATGMPTGGEAFALTTAFPNMPNSESSKRIGGASQDMYYYRNATDTIPSTRIDDPGGDLETRPVNLSVLWYVRFRAAVSVQGDQDGFPVGGILSYGGTLHENSNWLLCDGRQLKLDDYPELFDAIAFRYGGSVKDGLIQLPDYRGLFMRGDSGVSVNAMEGSEERVSLAATDDDAGETESWRGSEGTAYSGRSSGGLAVTAPAMYTQVIPSQVGTFQDYSTARPHTPFTMQVSNIPNGSHRTHGWAGSYAEARGTLSLSTGTGGGNAETRPLNVYVNFYIKARG